MRGHVDFGYGEFFRGVVEVDAPEPYDVRLRRRIMPCGIDECYRSAERMLMDCDECPVHVILLIDRNILSHYGSFVNKKVNIMKNKMGSKGPHFGFKSGTGGISA
jgi:hypothetical protein